MLFRSISDHLLSDKSLFLEDMHPHFHSREPIKKALHDVVDLLDLLSSSIDPGIDIVDLLYGTLVDSL